MPPKTQQSANLHTPEELLDNAEAMMVSKDPKLLRGAILEAITALECYVAETVFSTLKYQNMNPALVELLKTKTKMDFDSRLSILIPAVNGIANDETLWKNYKEAKEIRNKVTHSGRKVKASEARFVIDTVYKWLIYLGKNIELKLELFKFKQNIQTNYIDSNSDTPVEELVANYFGKNKLVFDSKQQIIFGKKLFDLILKYDNDIQYLRQSTPLVDRSAVH